MPTCPVCGDLLNPGAKVCALCGTNLVTPETELSAPPPAPRFEEGLKWEGLEDPNNPGPATPVMVLQVADDTRTSPTALPQAQIPPTVPGIPAPPPQAIPIGGTIPVGTALPFAEPVEQPVSPPQPVDRPAAGSRCLVLYGADKKPLHYFPLRKDVTLIGRQDPLRNVFPDINVDEWLDGDTARKVSRKHALVFHTRLDDSYSIRPLAGNTGTQMEEDMVEALKDYPLTPGTRLVLGGAVRFKFEVVS